MPSWFAPPTKKKNTHERCNCSPLHCRQWSNQMLLSCGALLAVHDELKFAVRVSGGFCVALCFSVLRNSVSHACTAILRLVHDSDSGRASVCTYYGIFFRFNRFSPFAEEGFISLISLLSLFSPIAGEGFTCLDHSMLSKKKKFAEEGLRALITAWWVKKNRWRRLYVPWSQHDE